MSKSSPISHGSQIFFIRNILIAQIEADTNRRAKAEKFAKDFKLTGSFPHLQFHTNETPKFQSLYEAPQRYLAVWSWLLSRECGSERPGLAVSLKHWWVLGIKRVQHVHSVPVENLVRE